jgi:hypothetical protein
MSAMGREQTVCLRVESPLSTDVSRSWYVRAMRVRPISLSILTTALAVCLLLGACAPGQRPFRQIQLCLNSLEDIPAFKSQMRSLAQSNGMRFGDRSIEAQAEAERIREVMPDAPVTRPMILISGRRGDGVGFGASNFAEAPTQIVIGFQLGRTVAGREFSDSVYEALAEHWLVREGPDPEASGAFPLAECGAPETRQ